MIHEIKEEIYISIYLIMFGIYILSSYDFLLTLFSKFKNNKVIIIILELIFFIGQSIITYYFSYYLAFGYIPIYFILFVFLGLVIYYKILKPPFINLINNIFNYVVISTKFIWKYFLHLLYSKTLIMHIISVYNKIKTKVIKYRKSYNNKKEKNH